jgi:hypothetical protein
VPSNLKNTLEIPPSPPGAAARETVIPAQAGKISGSTTRNHRKMWWLWSGACFVIVLLAAFAQPLLDLARYAAGSQLFSYILLVPFVSAYLLYLRRDLLPKAYVVDLPLGIVTLACGVGVLAFTYWSDFAGRALANNDRLALLTLSFLCCLAAGGFFFLGREWMRAAAFPLAYLIFMVPMPNAMVDEMETA